jgi:hypothetical protein
MARLQAINANKDGDVTAGMIAQTVTHPIDYGNDISSATVTVSSDSTTWLPLSPERTMEDEVEVKEEDTEEKFAFLEIGPTSFAELDEARDEAKADSKVKQVIADFMALVGNIMNFPSEKGKAHDLRQLVKEMEERLPEEEEMPQDEDGAEEKGSDTSEMVSTDRLFTIWKDAITGEYRWLGVYSNKFRDDDSPAEILAEEAHLRFIERVEKGRLEYPDLYVWHIPVPVGKADLLAYDDAGFSIAAGTVEEDFALALMKTSEDLAMSHGMPAAEIRRDETDKTVITDYVSTEVSVLPRWAAANKMTDFYVLDEEEAKMAIIPDEKRQQVANLLGDDLTSQLEAGLEARSDKALAEGIEFKEDDQPAEETAEEVETEEVEEVEEKTEESAETTEEVEAEEAEEPVAEAEDVAEESVEESDAGAAEEESATEEPTLQKNEVAEALAFVVETMTKQNQALQEQIAGLSERIDNIEDGEGDLQKSTEEQIAELAAGTPEASLTALLTSKLANVDSVIGNPVTRVDGRSALAKEGPEETDPESVQEGESGLFFKDWN